MCTCEPTREIRQMARTLGEQRKLPSDDVREIIGVPDATPYGSRRYANKASAINRKLPVDVVPDNSQISDDRTARAVALTK